MVESDVYETKKKFRKRDLSLAFNKISYKEHTFSLEKKSYPLANFKKLKISLTAVHFFFSKKVMANLQISKS